MKFGCPRRLSKRAGRARSWWFDLGLRPVRPATAGMLASRLVVLVVFWPFFLIPDGCARVLTGAITLHSLLAYLVDL